MPARRLPWVKLWPELMEREKIRQLNDSQYRTWTYCLLASSQLPERWRFDSLEHAAYLTRRPIKDVRALAAAHFLEARDDGVWMHDIGEYQDVYPSDIQRERSANPPPNTPPKLGKHSTNGRSNAPPNTPPTVVDGSLEMGDVRREIETRDRDEDVIPPAPAERPPTQVGKPTKIRRLITNETIERLVAEYGPRFGDEAVVRDWITRALNHTARLKCLDEALYVERTWLKPELAKLKARSDTAPIQEMAELIPVSAEANRAFQNCTRCGIRRLLVVSTTPLCGACADITVVAA